MFANVTVGKRLVAGFGLAALTLLMIASISYRNANLLIETEHWVAHTHQVRAELADLLSHLKDAETGQRGYIITGEESYLDPYKSGLAGVKTHAGRPEKSDWRQPRPAAPSHGGGSVDREQAGRAWQYHHGAPNPGFRCRTQDRSDECRQDVHGSDSRDSRPKPIRRNSRCCRSGPRRRAPAPT